MYKICTYITCLRIIILLVKSSKGYLHWGKVKWYRIAAGIEQGLFKILDVYIAFVSIGKST